MLGPGAYNTLEEEQIKRKYKVKHEKLLMTQIQPRKAIAKVGRNLAKAVVKVPEYEET